MIILSDNPVLLTLIFDVEDAHTDGHVCSHKTGYICRNLRCWINIQIIRFGSDAFARIKSDVVGCIGLGHKTGYI